MGFARSNFVLFCHSYSIQKEIKRIDFFLNQYPRYKIYGILRDTMDDSIEPVVMFLIIDSCEIFLFTYIYAKSIMLRFLQNVI